MLKQSFIHISETPYHLAFSIEVVIHIEIGISSLKVSHFDEERNGHFFRENLDLLDKVRKEAWLRTLSYKQKLANFYNKWVQSRTFRVGNLIIKKVGLTMFETHFGKLALNWEGPYTMVDVPYSVLISFRTTRVEEFLKFEMSII